MATQPLPAIWLERAMDAYEKGDYESAEVRLIISDHLAPNDHIKKLLNIIRQKLKTNNSSSKFSQFRDRKLDSEECIIIAKVFIERGDFEQAKKFLILAEKVCPGYYSKKLMKKVKNIENLRVRQQAKKEFANKWTEEARLHFESRNYDKAEELLIKAQKVYSTIQAQVLLQRVKVAKETERRNRESNRPKQSKFRRFMSYIFCCLSYGYVRFENSENENSFRTGNENNGNGSGNRSSYSFRQEDIPHNRDFFRNTTNSNRNNEDNFGPRQSSQYNFRSEDIPENNRRTRNTNNERASNNNNENRNNGNYFGYRRSNQYNFRAEDIPEHNFRSGTNNGNGDNTNRNNGMGSNTTGTQNNTAGTRNNATGARNNTTGARNNTTGARNNGRGYTDEQLEAVNRVLNSKDDLQRLGLTETVATLTEKRVKSAFRKLALILHPDKNKAPGANDAYLAINDAKTRLLKIIKS